MKKLLLLPALALTAFALLATTAFTPDEPPPKQVWICHFNGHAGVVTDYVLRYVPGMPRANQIQNCEGRDGALLYVSENGARNGHDARAQGRIDEYPDR